MSRWIVNGIGCGVRCYGDVRVRGGGGDVRMTLGCDCDVVGGYGYGYGDGDDVWVWSAGWSLVVATYTKVSFEGDGEIFGAPEVNEGLREPRISNFFSRWTEGRKTS